MPNAECRMPNAECRMPNAECRMSNVECRMSNVEMKAVLLLSGGLDSYTARAMARGGGWELCALTVRYGQVHVREVEAARRLAQALGTSRHLELDVPLSKIGGSALVG